MRFEEDQHAVTIHLFPWDFNDAGIGAHRSLMIVIKEPEQAREIIRLGEWALNELEKEK